ncbi:MAG: fibronectin type III domain-containing protein [Saprospiraceae bacterium]|nr:fibronectin type III domain-containing protein [Saprospiraceae bacterium]
MVGPCNFPNGTFGEVEDYCVIIVPASFCASPANIDTLSVYLTNAELGWDLVSPAISYVIRYRKAGEDLWEERTSLSPGIVLTDLEPCRDYEVQIQTVCGFSQSDTASNFAFHTSCITDIAPAPPNGFHWRVMPNPFTESLRIEIDAQGVGVLYQFKLDVLNAWAR